VTAPAHGARLIKRMLAASAGAVVLALLAGCSSDPLAQQFADGTQQNYISGAGVYKEYTPAERHDPITFESATEDGTKVSSADYAGDVYVVNFWYAGCPPCRLEAPELEKISTAYADKGVKFLGVNTYDQADTSLAFARKFGVTYPSVLDANDVKVQFAFSGSVAPNAVPTTLVLDREGRVAARWSGGLSDPDILESMIDRVLDEKS
jgi:thiol-disulfide isomerase/thioredoxin